MATQTLLQLKSRFYRFLGAYEPIVATSGSALKFTVASLADKTADSYKGWQLKVLTGDAANDLRVIGAGPNASGDLEPVRTFSQVIVSTDTGELWGNSIDGGTGLTNLFNDILAVARPVEETQLTIVDGQAIYDITSTVPNIDDFVWVNVRYVDPASTLPYREQPIHWAGTKMSGGKVTLEIFPTFTAGSPATIELWIKHRKTLAAFANDAATVDSQYADWLATEAALRHCVEMSENSNADSARWAKKANGLMAKVQGYRARYMPFTPTKPHFSRPQ